MRRAAREQAAVLGEGGLTMRNISVTFKPMSLNTTDKIRRQDKNGKMHRPANPKKWFLVLHRTK